MSFKTDLQQINHAITLEKACEFTSRFREQLPAIVHPNFASALPYAETFNKEVFNTLINITGSIGIRIYLGLDEENQIRMIVVAVDENNQAILSAPGMSARGLTAHGASESVIFEFAQRCPPMCTKGPLDA
jgi:hypothetical protein